MAILAASRVREQVRDFLGVPGEVGASRLNQNIRRINSVRWAKHTLAVKQYTQTTEMTSLAYLRVLRFYVPGWLTFFFNCVALGILATSRTRADIASDKGVCWQHACSRGSSHG
jgi:hypothetical protein